MNILKQIYLQINLCSASRSPTTAVPKHRRHPALDKRCPSDSPSPAGSQVTCSAVCPTEHGPACLEKRESDVATVQLLLLCTSTFSLCRKSTTVS